MHLSEHHFDPTNIGPLEPREFDAPKNRNPGQFVIHPGTGERLKITDIADELVTVGISGPTLRLSYHIGPVAKSA